MMNEEHGGTDMTNVIDLYPFKEQVDDVWENTQAAHDVAPVRTFLTLTINQDGELYVYGTLASNADAISSALGIQGFIQEELADE